MKRVVIFAMCFIAIAANAQEKKGGLAIELGFGATNYGNYSPVSAFQDNTGRYSLIPTEQLSIGYRSNSNWFMGLTINNAGGNSSFVNLNETFMNLNAMFDVREYYKLSEKFDLEIGASIGLLVHGNNFNYAGESYSFVRYGACGQFTLGLEYNIHNGTYLGIQTAFPYCGSYLGEKPELPMGLIPNDKTQNWGWGLQLRYGIKF